MLSPVTVQLGENYLQLKKKSFFLVSGNRNVIASGRFNLEASRFKGFIISSASPMFADIGESCRWFIPGKVKLFATSTSCSPLYPCNGKCKANVLFLSESHLFPSLQRKLYSFTYLDLKEAGSRTGCVEFCSYKPPLASTDASKCKTNREPEKKMHYGGTAPPVANSLLLC